MPASLRCDTTADRVARFVFGAIVGLLAGWSSSLYGATPDTPQGFLLLLAGCAVVAGGLGVVFGNRFIEWLIRHAR